MTRDEHKAIIQQMLGMINAEHQATASELLTTLSDDYEQTLANSETLTTQNQELTQRNETLREVNTKLFLKVGSPSNGGSKPPTPTEQDPPEKKLTFEELFNEKGDLI